MMLYRSPAGRRPLHKVGYHLAQRNPMANEWKDTLCFADPHPTTFSIFVVDFDDLVRSKESYKDR